MTDVTKEPSPAPAPAQRPSAPLRGARAALSKGLNRSDAERAEHLDAMRKVLGDPQLEKLHSWIHTNLIVLDSKAQAILGLYSLALAALTVFYSIVGPTAPPYVVAAIVVGFVVIAWSIVPLARVSYVYWSSTEEFRDPRRLLLDLLRVRDERTRLIRRSVLKGALTLTIFAFLLFWDIARRLAL